VLPVVLQPSQIEMINTVCSDPRRNVLNVDLTTQVISLHGGIQIPFTIDPMRRDDLLHGRDAVASTLQFASEIHAFEERHWRAAPWLKPPMGAE
jgi:3-isopropylmalate/(R)-2-methylmalate dehydratase small subunit